MLLVMFVSSHLSCPFLSPIMNFLQFWECFSLWLGNNWDLVLSHSDGTQVLTIYTTAAARSWAPQIQSWVCCIFFHKFFCEHFEDFETFQISKFWYLLLPNTESSHLVWPQIIFFPRFTLVPVSWQCPASDRLFFRYQLLGHDHLYHHLDPGQPVHQVHVGAGLQKCQLPEHCLSQV